VPPGSSRVEITVEADGDETVVRLLHHGLPDGAAEQHGDGWDHFLPRLAIVAAGGEAGPDPLGRAAPQG
jgi:activator of Hsp90 ATPase-like protein